MSTDTRNRSNSFDPDNGWSDDIESVCEAIRSNAVVMSQKHAKLYSYYSGQLKYYKIPVIIISGLNSVIAVGLQPYLEQGIISGSNCLLALLCGIIGSIELFLGIQTSMETENAASKNFYLLSVNIFKALSLDRHRRSHPGKEYLEEVYTEYSKLYENSALISSGKHTDKLSGVPVLIGNKLVDMRSDMSDSPPPSTQYKSIFGSRSKPSPPPIHQPIAMISGDEILRRGRKDMFTPEDVMETGTSLMGGGGFMRDMGGVMNQTVQFSEAMRDGARGMKNEVGREFMNEMKNEVGREVVGAMNEMKNEVGREVVGAMNEMKNEVGREVVGAMNEMKNGISDVTQTSNDLIDEVIGNALKSTSEEISKNTTTQSSRNNKKGKN
jgi:hypothetical protein